jgi:hypothetical protein
VEGHEASEGNEVGPGDLVEQLASVGCPAKVGVAAEDFAGDGLVAWVEATGHGLRVDPLELSQRFALGEEVVASASIHPPSPPLSSSVRRNLSRSMISSLSLERRHLELQLRLLGKQQQQLQSDLLVVGYIANEHHTWLVSSSVHQTTQPILVTGIRISAIG